MKKKSTGKITAKKSTRRSVSAKRKPARRVAKPKRTAKRRQPRREAARFTAQELRRFERALLAEKQDLLRQVSFTSEVMKEGSDEPSAHRTHAADQGTENYHREFASQLKSLEGENLRKIDDALERIRAGTYGKCLRCGGPISKARLLILPHARHCMRCHRG